MMEEESKFQKVQQTIPDPNEGVPVSPLAAVAGKPADLSHVLQLHFVPEGETAPIPVVSKYLASVLAGAADYPQEAFYEEQTSGGPMRPIRLVDVFRYMIIAQLAPPFDGFRSFYGALDGPSLPEDRIQSLPYAPGDPGSLKVDASQYDGVVLGDDVTGPSTTRSARPVRSQIYNGGCKRRCAFRRHSEFSAEAFTARDPGIVPVLAAPLGSVPTC